MSKSVELSLLKCLRCEAPIPAEEHEVAWVCQPCGQGQRLTPDGLAPLSVQWAAARPGGQLNWLPFWVFTGQVRFQRRENYGGRSEPDRLWEAPRRFYLPAFSASIQQMEQLGADLTRQQPPLRAGPPQGALSGCTLFPEDARHAAEFVVLTIEADRKDKLKSVAFQVDLGEAELWLLPFDGQPSARALALAT